MRQRGHGTDLSDHPTTKPGRNLMLAFNTLDPLARNDVAKRSIFCSVETLLILDKALIDPMSAVVAPPNLPPDQPPGDCATGKNDAPQMPNTYPSGF